MSCLSLKMSLTIRNSSRISNVRNVISNISHIDSLIAAHYQMLPSHLIGTCLFSNGPFYNRCRVPSRPTLALSPSLSLCLSSTLPFCPLFRFDIKSLDLM
jgi:hypothetical protein